MIWQCQSHLSTFICIDRTLNHHREGKGSVALKWQGCWASCGYACPVLVVQFAHSLQKDLSRTDKVALESEQ